MCTHANTHTQSGGREFAFGIQGSKYRLMQSFSVHCLNVAIVIFQGTSFIAFASLD